MSSNELLNTLMGEAQGAKERMNAHMLWWGAPCHSQYMAEVQLMALQGRIQELNFLRAKFFLVMLHFLLNCAHNNASSIIWAETI